MIRNKELGVEAIHFLLHLSADEILGMSSDFVCLVAKNKQRNLLLHNTSLGQNIIQIPLKNIRMKVSEFLWLQAAFLP